MNLAELRGMIRALTRELASHRRLCLICSGHSNAGALGRGRPGPCDTGAELAAELAARRDDLAHWFDPSPDQGVLA